MDLELLENYARESLGLIAQNVELFRQGHRAAYRVIAVQLRMLLCDTNRAHNRLVDISLLPRVVPHLTLAAIVQANNDELGFRFDHAATGVPLRTWLTQAIPGSPGLSIKSLILGVCEQDGGAHVDPHPNSPIWDYPLRAEAITRIAENIKDLRLLMAD